MRGDWWPRAITAGRGGCTCSPLEKAGVGHTLQQEGCTFRIYNNAVSSVTSALYFTSLWTLPVRSSNAECSSALRCCAPRWGPASPFFSISGLTSTPCPGWALARLLDFYHNWSNLLFHKVHRYFHPKVDKFFGITVEEILEDRPGYMPISEQKKKQIYAKLEKESSSSWW